MPYLVEGRLRQWLERGIVQEHCANCGLFVSINDLREIAVWDYKTVKDRHEQKNAQMIFIQVCSICFLARPIIETVKQKPYPCIPVVSE